MAVDIFACDEKEKALKAVDVIIDAIKPKKVRKIVRLRGYVYKEDLPIPSE